MQERKCCQKSVNTLVLRDHIYTKPIIKCKHVVQWRGLMFGASFTGAWSCDGNCEANSWKRHLVSHHCVVEHQLLFLLVLFLLLLSALGSRFVVLAVYPIFVSLLRFL